MSLYVKLQTEILTDAKILQAGAEGFTLWAKGLCYALQHLTDGFIPQESLQILGVGLKKPEQIAKKLCEIGLWQKVEGGYTVGAGKWAKHQQTKEQFESKKAQNNERQRRYKESRKHIGNALDNAAGNALVTPPDTDTDTDTDPNKKNKQKKENSIIPTVDQVAEYAKSRGNVVDPETEAQKFWDYWASIGWKRNRTPIKDWQATWRTWEQNAPRLKVEQGGTDDGGAAWLASLD